MKTWKAIKVFVWVVLVSSLVAGSSVWAQGGTASQYEAAGNQLYQSGDYAKAEQYFQAAVQLDPGNSTAYVGLGNSRYRAGKQAEALAAYEKALALDPTNAQLTQFVNGLKGSAAANVSPAAGGDPMQQATNLFNQKRYAEAIPLFEQALAANPSNAQVHYYWGYACAMTQDNKGAAYHFYKYDQLSPNPGVKAYADRLKMSLSIEDQTWVDAQVSGGTNVLVKKRVPFKKKGLRFMPALVLPSQSDLKSLAESVTASIAEGQASDPTMGGEVSVPTGFPTFRLEPYKFLTPNFEVGGIVAYSAVGHFKALITSDVLGLRLEHDYKFTSLELGLSARYYFGQPAKKLRPFLGAGVMFASVSAQHTMTLTVADYPELNDSASEKGSSGALGGEIQMGLDFRLGDSFHLGPMAAYRFMKASNVFVWDTAEAPPSIDLGGPMAGIMLAVSF